MLGILYTTRLIRQSYQLFLKWIFNEWSKSIQWVVKNQEDSQNRAENTSYLSLSKSLQVFYRWLEVLSINCLVACIFVHRF